jgi:hypothetical protein
MARESIDIDSTETIPVVMSHASQSFKHPKYTVVAIMAPGALHTAPGNRTKAPTPSCSGRAAPTGTPA